MTTSIPIGPPMTLVANTVYAMPQCRVLVSVQSGTGTVGASVDGSTFNNPTLTNNQFESAFRFVKATGADTIVALKRM